MNKNKINFIFKLNIFIVLFSIYSFYFYKCNYEYLCSDIITKFKIIKFIKYKNHITPKLKYIINISNPICFLNKEFLIFINNDDNEFDLSKIYPPEIIKNNNIRIVHKSKYNNNNKIICIFGVLESDLGLKIESEMLEWLLIEYDVYCIYQDYPGIYYEYPAIRFAQWFLKTKEIDLCLYIHTKGAFFHHNFQKYVRNCWKSEYSGKRKFKYINPLKKGIADITSILTNKNRIMWFNSYFITIQAFNIINEIKFKDNRYNYEGMFMNYTTIKVLGILKNDVEPDEACKIVLNYNPLNYI